MLQEDRNHLTVIKEKIILTDELIRLLEKKKEENKDLKDLCKQWSDKFFKYKKNVSGSILKSKKEKETLLNTLKEYIPFKDKIVNLQKQYQELEITYNNFISKSEIKYQTVSKELEISTKKCDTFFKQIQLLESKLLIGKDQPTRARKENNKISQICNECVEQKKSLSDIKEKHDIVNKQFLAMILKNNENEETISKLTKEVLEKKCNLRHGSPKRKNNFEKKITELEGSLIEAKSLNECLEAALEVATKEKKLCTKKITADASVQSEDIRKVETVNVFTQTKESDFDHSDYDIDVMLHEMIDFPMLVSPLSCDILNKENNGAGNEHLPSANTQTVSVGTDKTIPIFQENSTQTVLRSYCVRCRRRTVFRYNANLKAGFNFNSKYISNQNAKEIRQNRNIKYVVRYKPLRHVYVHHVHHKYASMKMECNSPECDYKPFCNCSNNKVDLPNYHTETKIEKINYANWRRSIDYGDMLGGLDMKEMFLKDFASASERGFGECMNQSTHRVDLVEKSPCKINLENFCADEIQNTFVRTLNQQTGENKQKNNGRNELFQSLFGDSDSECDERNETSETVDQQDANRRLSCSESDKTPQFSSPNSDKSSFSSLQNSFASDYWTDDHNNSMKQIDTIPDDCSTSEEIFNEISNDVLTETEHQQFGINIKTFPESNILFDDVNCDDENKEESIENPRDKTEPNHNEQFFKIPCNKLMGNVESGENEQLNSTQVQNLKTTVAIKAICNEDESTDCTENIHKHLSDNSISNFEEFSHIAKKHGNISMDGFIGFHKSEMNSFSSTSDLFSCMLSNLQCINNNDDDETSLANDAVDLQSPKHVKRKQSTSDCDESKPKKSKVEVIPSKYNLRSSMRRRPSSKCESPEIKLDGKRSLNLSPLGMKEDNYETAQILKPKRIREAHNLKPKCRNMLNLDSKQNATLNTKQIAEIKTDLNDLRTDKSKSTKDIHIDCNNKLDTSFVSKSETKSSAPLLIKERYKRPNQSLKFKDCPKSPTTEEMNRIDKNHSIRTIPLDKIRKLTPSRTLLLIKRIIMKHDDKTIVNQTLNTLFLQEPAVICSCLIQFIKKDTGPQSGIKDRPLVPVMSYFQKVVLGLLKRMETLKFPNLLTEFLCQAEKALLCEVNVCALIPLATMYVSVCKLTHNLMRMRRMCCDAFYFMGDLAVPFMFVTLRSWVEVLPKCTEPNAKLLPTVLVQTVHLKTCNMDNNYFLNDLKDLLAGYHGYSKERSNSDDIMTDLVAEFINGKENSAAAYAILILCKNEAMEWCYQQIDKHFKSLLCKTSDIPLIYKTLLLIRNIISQFDSDHVKYKQYEKDIVTLIRNLHMQLNGAR